MSHHCHARGCETPTKPELLMCPMHWGLVPEEIQKRVWATYRPGQEIKKNPSEEWFKAADAAILAVWRKELIGGRTILRKTALGEDRNRVYCVLDYETRSKAVIGDVGGYEYARHPSTKILCVAWRIGTYAELLAGSTRTKVWSPAIPAPYGDLKRALLDPEVVLVAHNAFFEQVITRFVLSKLINDPGLTTIPIARWICTASMARNLAFPGKLERACAALKLPVQKDKDGHRLMLKMSKPRKPTKKNPAIWHSKRSDLLRLMEYCRTDVDAEVALFTAIPNLSPAERRVWELDQKINFRGFLADRALVQKTLGMLETETARFRKETFELTQGAIESTDQRDAVLNWMRARGLDLPNLQKKTVEDAIGAGLAVGEAGKLLRLRQASSKTSTAKYEAFELRSRDDGRVRDNLVYQGAVPTGRWAGAGVQPQNFPARGVVEDTDHAAEILDDPDTDLELIRLIWGNPLDFFSSMLRSMIRPTPGKKLFGGDFAGIEVRVLFWIARYEAGLKALASGRDIYKEMAAEIYGIPVDRVTKAQREVGKRAILGLGYNMGKDKFFDTCKLFGQEVSQELAAKAVSVYRSVHHPIPQVWSNISRAAIAAVQNPGKRYTINRTAWWVSGKYLFCRLPSGRCLSYYGPEIRMKPTPWGDVRPTLYHWDLVGPGKKWMLAGTYGGKLTENVVQAIARDLMVASMFRAEENGYELLLTVHDELLAEREERKGSVEEFEKLMATLPPWGEGLPLKVEGWSGPRYKK